MRDAVPATRVGGHLSPLMFNPVQDKLKPLVAGIVSVHRTLYQFATRQAVFGVSIFGNRSSQYARFVRCFH
jgi:hypothetical protein